MGDDVKSQEGESVVTSFSLLPFSLFPHSVLRLKKRERREKSERRREEGEKGREEGEPFSHLVHFHEHRLTLCSISIISNFSLFLLFQIVSEENERVKIREREREREKYEKRE